MLWKDTDLRISDLKSLLGGGGGIRLENDGFFGWAIETTPSMVGAAFGLAFALGWFLVGAQQRSMRARSNSSLWALTLLARLVCYH